MLCLLCFCRVQATQYVSHVLVLLCSWTRLQLFHAMLGYILCYMLAGSVAMSCLISLHASEASGMEHK